VYVIPLVILVVVALVGVWASPIFAVILAVPLFGAFLAYVAFAPRADEGTQEPAVPGQPAQPKSESRTKGVWGEQQD
jgi:hypothetical protein